MTYCLKHYLYENLRDLDLVPTKVLNFFASKASFALVGFFGGLSLFVEDPRRRAELAMYVLPKGLESAWATARGKGYVVGAGKLGEALVSGSHYLVIQLPESFRRFFQLAAIGVGMVMVSFSQPSTPTRLNTVCLPSFSSLH